MRSIFVLASILLMAIWANTQERPALKDAFKDDFLVGVALNANQIFERDARGVAIVKAQFNSVSPENILKWEVVHPQPDVYDFSASDRYVEFGRKNKMFIVGHNLVWHNQTPKWVFEDSKGQPLTREALLMRMRQHIRKVVGRYNGRIQGWDVVNEALNEDGTMRPTNWFKIIGDDYIAKAFEYAHEADPGAELYYNDYSLENDPKRNGAIALLKKLKAQGVPVTGIGLQGHNKMDWPTVEQQDATISDFSNLGLKVMITELDIDVLPAVLRGQGAEVTQTAEYRASVNPYVSGLPAEVQQALAERYADLFRVYLKHRDAISRVTFWCVTDGDSWLNNWPIAGRASYPLLFDRNGQPKPAFDAVVAVAEKETAAE